MSSLGNSLAIQCLGLCAFTVGALVAKINICIFSPHALPHLPSPSMDILHFLVASGHGPCLTPRTGTALPSPKAPILPQPTCGLCVDFPSWLLSQAPLWILIHRKDQNPGWVGFRRNKNRRVRGPILSSEDPQVSYKGWSHPLLNHLHKPDGECALSKWK